MFLKFENLEDLVCTFKDADAVDSIELMLFIYLFIYFHTTIHVHYKKRTVCLHPQIAKANRGGQS